MDTHSIVILAAAVFIVVLYAGYIYGKKRGDALREFARSRNLTFSRSADIDLAKEFPGFQLFLQGTDKTIRNLVSGETDGVKLMLFDYQYTAGTGQSSASHNQTVLLMRSGKLDLPFFRLYPENIIHRLLTSFGKQDKSFQSWPEFSKSYVLAGGAGDEIKKAFSDQALSYFARHKGLVVEGNGQNILLYHFNTLTGPDRIRSLFTDGMEILRLFEKGF
jgi:hypothetical protein